MIRTLCGVLVVLAAATAGAEQGAVSVLGWSQDSRYFVVREERIVTEGEHRWTLRSALIVDARTGVARRFKLCLVADDEVSLARARARYAGWEDSLSFRAFLDAHPLRSKVGARSPHGITEASVRASAGASVQQTQHGFDFLLPRPGAEPSQMVGGTVIASWAPSGNLLAWIVAGDDAAHVRVVPAYGNDGVQLVDRDGMSLLGEVRAAFAAPAAPALHAEEGVAVMGAHAG